MEKDESPPKRPQREADRRKRQAEALKANLKRRKATGQAIDVEESDDSSA